MTKVSVLEAEIRQDFENALRSAGFILDEAPIMDGNWHRAPVEGGKKSQKDGSYKAVLPYDSFAGKANGFIKNFLNPELSGPWKPKKAYRYAITSSDRERLEKERAERLAQEKAAYETVSALCVSIYDGAADADPEHPYLTEKNIKAYGLKQTGQRLIVPLRDVNGKITSLQYIMPSGIKRFVQGGKKLGAFHLIGEVSPDKPVGIAEGYATGATIHEANGIPVAVAFDSGNLRSVAMTFRRAYPDKELFIFADDDRFARSTFQRDSETGKIRPGRVLPNIGRIAAKDAAEAAKAKVIFPRFHENDWKGTDFNDLAAWSGMDEVRNQVQKGVDRSLTMPRTR